MQVGESSRREWVAAALERFEGPLIRYAAHILGDVDTARDVVQDTFLRLWTADRDQVEDGLAAWLYTVCRNRAFDVMRKERRMVSLETAQPDARPSDGPSARTAIEIQERRTRATEILDTLPPNQREVICLKFQDALSYKEISRVTGLSVTNVGYLIHVGIKTIRRRLAEQGGAAVVSEGALS